MKIYEYITITFRTVKSNVQSSNSFPLIKKKRTNTFLASLGMQNNNRAIMFNDYRWEGQIEFVFYGVYISTVVRELTLSTILT